VKSGQLKVVLADAEYPALPIHLLTPQGRIGAQGPRIP